MVEPIERLMKKIAVDFTNPQLLVRAVTHRSVSAGNNERLEFLGDAVLGLVIARALFERFPHADEGQLTRLRAKLVRRETLAELAQDIDLESYLIVGQGELKTGGTRRASIQADAFEAIIGAIEQDQGYEAARQFILACYQHRIENLTLTDVEKDPKTLLQEYLQARNKPLPQYMVIAIEGDTHEQLFKVSCEVTGLSSTIIAEGKSRRKAEQAAASTALQLLLQVNS